MYCIEVLVAEHENVLRLNATMRAACLKALREQVLEPGDFRQFVCIIRRYADKHHHRKEELLLFKEMEDKLGAAAQKLVRHGMLVEHDLGRLFAQQLEEALDRYEAAEELGSAGEEETLTSVLDVITNAMGYADLLGRHIAKENDVVYKFALNNLDAATLATLDERTRTFEQEAQDSGFLDAMLGRLDKLEQKYLG